MAEEQMIGIDLGTTNSLIAFWSQNGAELIPNAHGNFLTPSVIYINEQNELLVGDIAVEKMSTAPGASASFFKRFMGTAKTFEIRNNSYRAEELSSFVIRALIKDAEIYLKRPINEAVISVPAYFNELQRNATKQAAELAGIKVKKLINEPSAAGLTYGLQNKHDFTQHLVIDLGGGTFDISILDYYSGVMEIKGSAGDVLLGGEDFTHVIMQQLMTECAIAEADLTPSEAAYLLKKSEQIKKRLSDEEHVNINFKLKDKDYQYSYNLANFISDTRVLNTRLRKPIERVLRDAKVEATELDSIILVGGATKMPMIRQQVSRMFNKLPISYFNPEEVVALGTAVQAGLIAKGKGLEEVVFTDICPFTLGIEIVKEKDDGYQSGFFLPIIERNSAIPVSKVKIVYPQHEEQKSVLVNVFQGESRKIINNLKLGELSMELPKGKSSSVRIRFTYDVNGLLDVEVTDADNNTISEVFTQNSKGLSARALELSREKLKQLKIHPREEMENVLIMAKLERYWQESIAESRRYFDHLIEEFDHVLNSQDRRQIDKHTLFLTNELKNYQERGLYL